MKKNLTKAEALAVARRLDLTQYTDIDSLVESLHIESNREINVCVFTTDKRSAEHIFASLTGLKLRMGLDSTFKAEMQHGETQYTLVTGYGRLGVDEERLCCVVPQKNTECLVATESELLKNIRLTLVYTPEYGMIGTDTWRCMLLEADEAVMVLNAAQILPQTEQEFVKTLLLPVFSSFRLSFGIGNAQYIRPEEWPESVARVHRLSGGDYPVFPIFTEELPDDVRVLYGGSELSTDSVLEQTNKNALDLRRLHLEDFGRYENAVLEKALHDTRKKLEEYKQACSGSVASSDLDIAMLEKSRKRIESYIDLFLHAPLAARYRDDVEKFGAKLIRSLSEDIMLSEDIKNDSKSLPRYLSYVWDQFAETQTSMLTRLFEKETSTIVEMMNLDLKKIVREIRRIDLDRDLQKHLDNAFSVHTFFARKTSPGNGLTEALTIGGVITVLFNPALGITAVLSSELIKVFGKKKFDREYKEELAEKIPLIVERNMNELISQADANFKKLADTYREEILGYYDETTEGIRKYLSEEKSRLAEASENIDFINSLI